MSSSVLSLVRRFWALTGSDRRLLVEAWWELLTAAFGLRLAPGRTLALTLRAPPETAPRPDTRDSVPGAQVIARAVARAAAHHLGPMTCLPRAVALQRLLAKRGFAARVAIGVRREGDGTGGVGASGANGAIAAHAWVEVEGRAVGEPEAIAERFLPFVERRSR